MWQGALRNPDDATRTAIIDEISAGEAVTVEVLYSDQVGRQRTISRFGLMPAGDTWIASLTRHWYLDWQGPRPESLALAASEAIMRDREAAIERRAAADAGPPASSEGAGSAADILSGSE
jgi:hypothetical protein